MTHLNQALKALLTQHAAIVVAFSGGRDSAALLHALSHCAKGMPLPPRIIAVHVNHHIQEVAQAWPGFADSFVSALKSDGCDVIGVNCDVHLPKNSGDSLEALARDARYEALVNVAAETGATAVVLGHHLKDQVETFFLQAFRGAGVAGLACMPVSIERFGLSWERPWLNVPRQEIDAYITEHNVSFVDDPSNFENHYARNRVRNVLIPAMQREFPGFEKAVYQTAAWCAEANEALQLVAGNDLRDCMKQDTLQLGETAVWPVWRLKNLIRAWYGVAADSVLPTTTLERVISLVQSGNSDGKRVPGRGTPDILLRHNSLAIAPAARLHEPTSLEDFHCDVNPDTVLQVPGPRGSLRFVQAAFGLQMPCRITVGPRRTGVTFQKGPKQPARPLKNQFQSLNVKGSERKGPYVYVGDALVWANGLGIDCRACVPNGWVPVWTPSPEATVQVSEPGLNAGI